MRARITFAPINWEGVSKNRLGHPGTKSYKMKLRNFRFGKFRKF